MRPGWRHNRRPKRRDQGGIRDRASRSDERGRGPPSQSCRRSTYRGRVSAGDTPIADIDAPRHRRADRVSATPPPLLAWFQQELYGCARIDRKRRWENSPPRSAGQCWSGYVARYSGQDVSSNVTVVSQRDSNPLWSKRDQGVIELRTRPCASTLWWPLRSQLEPCRVKGVGPCGRLCAVFLR